MTETLIGVDASATSEAAQCLSDGQEVPQLPALPLRAQRTRLHGERGNEATTESVQLQPYKTTPRCICGGHKNVHQGGTGACELPYCSCTKYQVKEAI